ncbi:prepilin peptidase [Micromonospora krabiensis]|uniref:Leader peptidase (Prepilin peptidase) / N-methyltransferase n=1 Tax=Micromonospora krabiensis TaxID=307121 RepID=A0A1C3N8M3_9ACTN|nr:prepilin peptidase [Micromonospora krabiensis]SBV28944.1 leader peptidase (prepilin peptidase) / N-methyltransferase [Micromonospora krabiensis]
MPAGPSIVAVLLGALVGLGAPRLARRVVAALPPVVGVRPPLPGPALPVPGAGPSIRGGVGTVVAGAIVFGGLTVALGIDPVLPVFLALAAVGLVLALVDRACLRLPDALVGAAALVAGLGLTGVALVTGTPDRLLGALLGALVAGGTHVVLALLPRSRLGFGDVKLATVLGLPLGWLGWPTLWLGLLLPHLLHGLLVLMLLATRRVRRDTTLPLGPALLTGTWLATLLP